MSISRCIQLVADGWNYDTPYRFHVTHLPDTGGIRLKLYEVELETKVHESSTIMEKARAPLIRPSPGSQLRHC